MRRWTIAVVSAVLATAAGGCGRAADDHVPPTVWARSVCSAVVPWTVEVRQLQDRAGRRISAKSDVEQSKTELVQLFSQMELATDAAVRRVRGAGVPRVSGGERIASQFVRTLAAARDSFGTGMSAVVQLPTTDRSAFYNGVAEAGRTMSKNVTAGRALATVSSPELDKAFDQIPNCRR